MVHFGICLAVLVATLSTAAFAAPTVTDEPPITNVSYTLGSAINAVSPIHTYKPGLAFVPDLIVTPEGDNITILSSEAEADPPGQQPIVPDPWVITSTGTFP